MDGKQLIQRYLLGEASQDEVSRLSQELESNEQLRQQFILASHIDAALRERSIEETLSESIRDDQPLKPLRSKTKPSRFVVATLAALAATVLIAIGFWNRSPQTIASIASSENAAWESALPTNVGAELTAGHLELKRGLSTIKFRSGVELMVEAPASLELLNPMRARLLSGTAVVNVPDSAIGFVLETPNGYAVDYGTRFSVEIDQENKTSNFALLEGQIELHHPQTGRRKMLSDSGTSAVVSAEDISVQAEVLEENAPIRTAAVDDNSWIRVSSNGRCRSVVKFEKFQDRKIIDDLLYVKSGNNPNWNYKSYFQFDLSTIDLERLSNARLRLNLVPSPLGVASLLPRVNRFAVFGITDPQARQWQNDQLWSQSPSPEDGILLGEFEVLRSQQRGTFGIEGERLTNFIQEYGKSPITLLITRETDKTDGVGKGLVHAFASDRHPESVGPLLELMPQH